VTYTRTTVPAPTTHYTDVSCSACGTPLTHALASPAAASAAPWSDLQADSALRLDLHGGFGMYIDPFGLAPDEADALTILLCHTCADTLCTTFPYFAQAVSPCRNDPI